MCMCTKYDIFVHQIKLLFLFTYIVTSNTLLTHDEVAIKCTTRWYIHISIYMICICKYIYWYMYASTWFVRNRKNTFRINPITIERYTRVYWMFSGWTLFSNDGIIAYHFGILQDCCDPEWLMQWWMCLYEAAWNEDRYKIVLIMRYTH